jgi:glucose 1-dehydrogenase
MKALTVVPGRSGTADLTEVPEPNPSEGALLVEAAAVGICGTDEEIVKGAYGAPPPGRDRLVLGHESLGRVLEAPDDSTLEPGDMVVGIVRHPDPVPCPNCAVGEWDMCRNGRYTEHGIKERDGFLRERYRLEPEMAVKVDPELGQVAVLTEPTSVVAKAWDHVERIGARARWGPERVLVAGAGPIGLLAAMLGLQRDLDVHVLDRLTAGPKPGLVKDLGATYHADLEEVPHSFDVIVECTGVGQLVFDLVGRLGPNGTMALTGIGSTGRQVALDAAATNRRLVLGNAVVFGSVNANRRHYEHAREALGRADRGWLERLVSRWVPLGRWPEALDRRTDDVKTVIELGA